MPGRCERLTASGGITTENATLLDGTTTGGFENATSTFAANGWTQAGTSAPTWFVGTAGGAQNGTKAAFYGSSASTYGTGSSTTTVNHFYRDVAIPSGATNVLLNYYYKMPTVDADFDYFYVHTGSSALSAPVVGSLPSGYTQQFVNTATSYSGFTSMPAINLTSFAGSTVRIIFSLRTDAASPYANPAVDNIRITATVTSTSPFVWTPSSGLFDDAGATIPYSGTPTATVYASPSSTTTYTATATNGAGCSNSGSAIVNFTTIPPSISSYSTGCSGQILSVNGNSLVTVTAATVDGISVTPTIINDNQVTLIIPPGVTGNNIPVTLTSGCGIASDNTLTVNPTPQVAAAPTNQTKCTGADISQIILTNPNSIAGTVISWTRSTPAGTGGSVPLSGSGSSPVTIDGILTSSNTAATPVVFTINAVAAGCTTSTTSTVPMTPLSPEVSLQVQARLQCVKGHLLLSATAGNQPAVTIYNENFNGAATGGPDKYFHRRYCCQCRLEFAGQWL